MKIDIVMQTSDTKELSIPFFESGSRRKNFLTMFELFSMVTSFFTVPRNPFLNNLGNGRLNKEFTFGKINFTFLTTLLKTLFPTLRQQCITTPSIFLLRLINTSFRKRNSHRKLNHSFHIRRRPPIWMKLITNPKFLFWVFFNVFLLKIQHYYCS